MALRCVGHDGCYAVWKLGSSNRQPASRQRSTSVVMLCIAGILQVAGANVRANGWMTLVYIYRVDYV